jgi:hypothetical protein
LPDKIIPALLTSFAISSELIIGIFEGIRSYEEVVLPIPFGPAITYKIGIILT